MIKHVKVQLVFQRSDSSDATQHRKCPWKVKGKGLDEMDGGTWFV